MCAGYIIDAMDVSRLCRQVRWLPLGTKTLHTLQPLPVCQSLCLRAAVAMEERKPCVLVQKAMLPNCMEELERRYKVWRLWECPDPSFFAPDIQALVSCGTVSRDLIDTFPNLRLVANYGVGVDGIDLAYCRSKHIGITNTPDVLTDDCADLAILLMLAACRHLCPADRFVRDGLWTQTSRFPLAKKASGSRVGIVGLGRIGMAIAKRAEAFGCKISYFGRAKKSDVSYTYFDNLVDLASNSDILIIACSLSNDTKHLINREVLDALGQEGVLVNISRGPVVDESELVKALAEGRIGAAGLDVFENEPHVPHELPGMDNVVLSPHAASATWETRAAMGNLVLDNLHAFFSGKPLLTPVN